MLLSKLCNRSYTFSTVPMKIPYLLGYGVCHYATINQCMKDHNAFSFRVKKNPCKSSETNHPMTQGHIQKLWPFSNTMEETSNLLHFTFILWRGEMGPLCKDRQSCPCTYHEGIWASGDTAPHNLHLSTRQGWLATFLLWSLYFQGKSPHYPPIRNLGGPQKWSGMFWSQNNCLGSAENQTTIPWTFRMYPAAWAPYKYTAFGEWPFMWENQSRPFMWENQSTWSNTCLCDCLPQTLHEAKSSW